MIFKVISQSTVLATKELYNNKLRALLSLTGIAIGILCIISVFTAVDSLERNIKKTIQSFGNNLVFVEKWPWEFKEDYPWWIYLGRPNVSPSELKLVQVKSKLAAAVAYQIFASSTKLESGDNVANGVSISGISEDYSKLKEFAYADGRFFLSNEFYSNQGVVILGNSISTVLFPNDSSAIGKYVKYQGDKLKVVGVLKKEGKDIFQNSNDNIAYVTTGYLLRFIDPKNTNVQQQLLVKPKEGIDLEELKSELTGILRSTRRLGPFDIDNFALNQISMITSIFDPVFLILYIIGFIIGGFSILVGGFGIANIMFVSVKERTSLIGVKKALGARNSYILIEFLIEAILLCLVGGIIGLALVLGLFKLANYGMSSGSDINFEFVVSTKNILIGLFTSIFLGIVFGIIPALMASRLNPVDAMRST